MFSVIPENLNNIKITPGRALGLKCIELLPCCLHGKPERQRTLIINQVRHSSDCVNTMLHYCDVLKMQATCRLITPDLFTLAQGYIPIDADQQNQSTPEDATAESNAQPTGRDGSPIGAAGHPLPDSTENTQAYNTWKFAADSASTEPPLFTQMNDGENNGSNQNNQQNTNNSQGQDPFTKPQYTLDDGDGDGAAFILGGIFMAFMFFSFF